MVVNLIHWEASRNKESAKGIWGRQIKLKKNYCRSNNLSNVIAGGLYTWANIHWNIWYLLNTLKIKFSLK